VRVGDSPHGPIQLVPEIVGVEQREIGLLGCPRTVEACAKLLDLVVRLRIGAALQMRRRRFRQQARRVVQRKRHDIAKPWRRHRRERRRRRAPFAGRSAASERFWIRGKAAIVGARADDVCRRLLPDRNTRIGWQQSIRAQVVLIGSLDRCGLCGETVDQHVPRGLRGCGYWRARRADNRRVVRFEPLLERLDGVVDCNMHHRPIQTKRWDRTGARAKSNYCLRDEVPVGHDVCGRWDW
jgi:hypothetical protein